MALELTGIENIGEFYSGHYLSAVLEGDLKSILQGWKTAKEENGTRPPYKALGGLSNRYFGQFGKAEGERDQAERLAQAQDFHAFLLEALGYERDPHVEPLEGDTVLPVHLALRRDGNPFLWVVDAPFPENDGDVPLDSPPLDTQLPEDATGAMLPKAKHGNGQLASWREILDEHLFRLDHAPRWVLFLAGSEAVLIERHKWPQGKYLRFDFSELFGRKQASAFRAMAGLLHRDVLAPDAGLCLHDSLDENSHKHAYSVSGDLKHGVRRAVELLANEAVWYRREVQKQGVFNEEELAGKLTTESLTWLYRLLFLFYIEARGSELGTVPMQSDAYRKGYSLEGLRDLELVPLTTEHARNGNYIHESLKTLFRILNMGFPEFDPESPQGEMRFHSAGEMRIDALNSPLFDDERLELLKGVRFRNHVLQEVLQLLSLSSQKKKKGRGRISYAQLGINQLGSVYEGLLSYTGFFATEDLYEVASEKDNKKLSGKSAAEREALKTYFVPASRIGDYKETEIVRDEHNKKVVHPKGSFVFRLAGRNREKSASYYTPEVLTQCLVKYALKELLWEEGDEGAKPTRKKTADEILALTICEPAMGSSAFLIEAVDQLADAYLEARQEEVKASGGETIPPEDYQREKRRVKARFATNNCYGVDLNPTAVELAKVSLWLATLHEDSKCPWFGLRLATGNSLVGARREVFKTADVTRKGTKDTPNWLGLVPEPVPLHHGEDAPSPDEVDWANWIAPPRPKGTIYHFLLPAEGMAAFDKDKVLKQLAPDSVKRIKDWRTEFCKPFNKKDAERLEQISDAVDRLFAQVVRERALAIQETSDRIAVWGEVGYEDGSTLQANLLVRDQEEVAASLEDGSSAYRRLKLAMDAWCALWFWPIEEAGLLPDRVTWLAQMELILKGQVTHREVWLQQSLFAELSLTTQGDLVARETVSEDVRGLHEASAERLKLLKELSDAFSERRVAYFDECGLADIDAVLEVSGSLRRAQAITDRLRFHHWPLRFAEVFAASGGFDLILGNPPWVKLTWKEGDVLADYDPSLSIRSVGAAAIAKTRSQLLDRSGIQAVYFDEFSSISGLQEYLTAQTNYSELGGATPNLYKAFISTALSLGSEQGIVGLVTPQSLYSDSKGQTLRAYVYPRLRFHCHFRNELPLFTEVLHTVQFCINVLSARKGEMVRFRTISNLIHPLTVDSSMCHDGYGPVPGVKSGDGGWEVRGHSGRILEIDIECLQDFVRLFDKEGTRPLEATLPAIHSNELLRLARQFSSSYPTLERLDKQLYGMIDGLHETLAQESGQLRKDTEAIENSQELVFQGAQLSLGGLPCKTPNANCRNYHDYSDVDLTEISEGYLPRTNFTRTCSSGDFEKAIPAWRGKPATKYYRHAQREMISTTGARALIGAIIPPGVHHVNTVFSVVFADLKDLIAFSGLSLSVPVDFFVKLTGKGHANVALTSQLPYVSVPDGMVRRTLGLNAITKHYAPLWDEAQPRFIGTDSFTKPDARTGSFERFSRSWNWESPFRNDLERRQALVEIDVLSAQALGMRLSELQAIYLIQFPRLQYYEAEYLYDQKGLLVPAAKTAGGNPAVSLVELAATLKEQAGFDVHAEYHPDGSNTQELRKQKIRLGKKEAGVLGVSERCTMADLLAETEVRWSGEDYPEGRPVRLVGLRYTDPGLEPRMERVYPTPWTRCDREADYRQAWAEFERRLGKKMPEDTQL
jgi:hypothetical protein